MGELTIAESKFPLLNVLFRLCEDKEEFLNEVETLATFFVSISPEERTKAKHWARGVFIEKEGG